LIRPEHRVNGLGPVGDELGLVTRPAVDAGTALSGVGCEQLLEQRAAQLGHRHADREFHRGQPLAPASAAERAGCLPGEPGYLGGELRLELRVEAPFSAVGGGAASSASGDSPLASQIASLTSTIDLLTAMNSW